MSSELARVLMQFNLCAGFALFAVSVLVLPQRTRRTRKEIAKECFGIKLLRYFDDEFASESEVRTFASFQVFGCCLR